MADEPLLDLLRRSEEPFASVFRLSPIAIGIGDVSTGRLIDVNERCAEFFGRSRAEMIGRTVFELGMWADVDERERLIARLRSGEPVRGVEVGFRHRSGELLSALVSMEILALAALPEPVNVVMIDDITDRKRLQNQLLQAQKMEAIGRLAGGVAHDFNNLLGVIIGYGEMLLREVEEPQRGRIEQMLAAAQRASSLTRQLLAFSRKQVLQARIVDPNHLLGDIEKMLRRLIGEDIELVLKRGDGLGKVRVDPGQLDQVVLNLCLNARDAMADGGTLTVETAEVELTAGRIADADVEPGPYVMIAVSDTGTGIEPALFPRLFEPFFTTKEKGRGTGLGLSMVYGIVRQSGGHVQVESRPGQGTAFRVYLPRIEPVAEAVAPQGMDPDPSEPATILLVEDEPALLTIAREVLEQAGYRVLAVDGGHKAIEVSDGHGGDIDLLLTDVVMPGMNGRALAEALTARRPALKVLYMSGYTDDVVAQRVLDAGTMLLAKPFTSRVLLERTREALTGARLDGA